MSSRFNISVGYANSKCLSAVVKLGISDILRQAPRTLTDLAGAGGARPDRLRQVMRTSYNNGIFAYDSESDTYSNNRISELLASDHWAGWSNWVELYGSEFYDAARGIPAACEKSATRSPAQINYDTDDSMFKHFMDQGWLPRLHKTLGAGAIAQAPGILVDYPWGQIADGEFLDVGGGGGALVASLLRKHHRMRGGILDLPQVIEHAKKNFHTPEGEFADVGDRVPEVRLVSGDFLEEVPSFDYYTMKWCLHDWDDSKALKVMTNIRRAIKRGHKSRLIILESVLENGRASRLSRYADLNMWIAVNGQERTEAHWKHLARSTGWNLNKVYPLRNAWPCAIELIPDYSFSGTTESNKSTTLANSTHTNSETVSNPIIEVVSHSAANPNLSSDAYPTTMSFLEPWDPRQGEPFFRSACEPGFQSMNFRWQDYNVTVADARPHKHLFTLDTNAFAYLDDPDGLPGQLLEALRSGDKELAAREYYPRIEMLLKAHTGASRVIPFDSTTRRRDPSLRKEDNPNGKEQPATTVHCDQGPEGAWRRLRMHLPTDEDPDAVLAAHRVQILNVWRPLRGPVTEWPLTQMDFTSLQPGDVHPCNLWRGAWEDRGQTVTFTHAAGQRWFYLDAHHTDEVTLLKIWDSREGVAACCPHAAFAHPNTPTGCEPRESVEVRCLVIY